MTEAMLNELLDDDGEQGDLTSVLANQATMVERSYAAFEACPRWRPLRRAFLYETAREEERILRDLQWQALLIGAAA